MACRNTSTAMLIIIRYKNGERPLKDNRGGRSEESVKLTEEIMERIVAMIGKTEHHIEGYQGQAQSKGNVSHHHCERP